MRTTCSLPRTVLKPTIGALVCLTVLCCSSGSRNLIVGVKAQKAHLIARTLQECEDWAEIPEHAVKQRQQITETYIDVAHYDTNTIRDGIVLYLDKYPVLNPQRSVAGDKIFALLRVVFKVPHFFDTRKEPLPFDVYGNPTLADGVDLLWPFSVATDGRLLLSGVDGGHSGLSYDPLRDFDQMALRLERRFPLTR